MVPLVCMELTNIGEAISVALQQEWGISASENISKEHIIDMLALRLTQILDQGPERFYQLMYRLDISEKKLNAVLQEPDVAIQIAILIYDRQLQKVVSRQQHAKDTDIDPELRW